MIGSDTQTDDHKVARCFSLALPKGEKGSQASSEFLVQITEAKAPSLQRWNGAVSATPNASGADFAFTPISTTQSTLTAVTHQAKVASGGATVWVKESATSPTAFSNYVLEDFQAPTASAVANSEVKAS